MCLMFRLEWPCCSYGALATLVSQFPLSTSKSPFLVYQDSLPNFTWSAVLPKKRKAWHDQSMLVNWLSRCWLGITTMFTGDEPWQVQEYVLFLVPCLHLLPNVTSGLIITVAPFLKQKIHFCCFGVFVHFHFSIQQLLNYYFQFMPKRLW